jgi:hypothetical protein
MNNAVKYLNDFNTYVEYRNNVTSNLHMQNTSSNSINTVQIDKIVEDILASDSNVYGLPDSLERALYKKILSTAMLALKKTIEGINVTINIDMLGNEFTIHGSSSSSNHNI